MFELEQIKEIKLKYILITNKNNLIRIQIFNKKNYSIKKLKWEKINSDLLKNFTVLLISKKLASRISFSQLKLPEYKNINLCNLFKMIVSMELLQIVPFD